MNPPPPPPTPLAPESPDALRELVRSRTGIVPVGAGTKPRFARVDERYTRVSVRNLRGIVEYEPDEFTITAGAGTPVRELVEALEARGQYLPFDPLLVSAGSTLGGTIASGLNGPGRFRFGGIRDFVLGVRFIDGLGRHLRMGGKVVKNAAGFDVSKFLVGSLGRFGVITEATLKVFPRRTSRVTLRLAAKDHADAVRIVGEAANSRWEIDALEIGPGDPDVRVRLAGPDGVPGDLAREILGRWRGGTVPEDEATAYWGAVRELEWAHGGGLLVRIPLTPERAAEWAGAALAALPGARLHLGGAANVGWLSCAAADAVGCRAFLDTLAARGLGGITVRDDGTFPLWVGAHRQAAVFGAVKRALDPEGRFPALTENTEDRR